ncbi:MAG: alanine racemase [Verrucomicrobiota bacterium]|nr:alanine racemase [Verrucomicrobiota bacterium]
MSEPAVNTPGNQPLLRASWIEIDLAALRENFRLINGYKDRSVDLISVLKDDAYSHGAVEAAKIAMQAGAKFIALVTVDEAIRLREAGIQSPILMLGQRRNEDLPYCLQYNLTCCINDRESAEELVRLTRDKNIATPVHLKVDTGMSRFGVRWTEAGALIDFVCSQKSLRLEGVMSHFAMSDELDKSFAFLQLSRFQEVLELLEQKNISVRYRHFCNSGGLLDLPQAHLDAVRIGLLPLGIYPSKVCRRIEGIRPVMSVKTKLAQIRTLQKDDVVGYGMRYRATEERRIAVLPIGYGDGFPRVRNQGEVLIRGKRAPLIGGVSMDAITVDITNIPEANRWDEAVIMGRQGSDEISVHELALLKNSVSYDVLTGLRGRLPRVYLNT